jgi:hypothetical protein
MPDPSITASGERFARDMRRIREDKEVSMEDIHDATMISTHIIESFEQDGLFEHPTFNQVYLRSFVRSYANAAGIKPERALEELARALEGAYANELAVEYLGDDPMEPVPPPSTGEGESPDETSGGGGTTGEGSGPLADTPAGEAQKASSAASSAAAGEPAASDRVPDSSRQGIIIGIGIVVIVIAAWMLVDLFSGNTPSSQPAGSSASTAMDSADMARLEPIPAESLRADAPRVALGDTMYFTVIAQERVNPIRIRRDEDLRRPYYLNRGQAGVFPAQELIVLEGPLENIRLLVNGHAFPMQGRGAGGSLVLNRDSVQVFLDTTDTTPLSLVVPADTFQVLGG